MMEGRRILVVDGEPDLADAARGYLELHGYLVPHAADGVDATQLPLAQGHRPRIAGGEDGCRSGGAAPLP